MEFPFKFSVNKYKKHEQKADKEHGQHEEEECGQVNFYNKHLIFSFSNQELAKIFSDHCYVHLNTSILDLLHHAESESDSDDDFENPAFEINAKGYHIHYRFIRKLNPNDALVICNSLDSFLMSPKAITDLTSAFANYFQPKPKSTHMLFSADEKKMVSADDNPVVDVNISGLTLKNI